LRKEIRVAHKENDKLLAKLGRLENELNNRGRRENDLESPSPESSASAMNVGQ
jgi:hypothetical protein